MIFFKTATPSKIYSNHTGWAKMDNVVPSFDHYQYSTPTTVRPYVRPVAWGLSLVVEVIELFSKTFKMTFSFL